MGAKRIPIKMNGRQRKISKEHFWIWVYFCVFMGGGALSEWQSLSQKMRSESTSTGSRNVFSMDQVKSLIKYVFSSPCLFHFIFCLDSKSFLAGDINQMLKETFHPILSFWTFCCRKPDREISKDNIFDPCFTMSFRSKEAFFSFI